MSDHSTRLSSQAAPPARVCALLGAVRTRAGALLSLWGRRPVLTTLIGALVAVLVVVIGDISLIAARIDRVDVAMPTALADGPATVDLSRLAPSAQGTVPPRFLPVEPSPAQTWLLVGTDSRENLPPGGTGAYGTTEQAGAGERADVLALVQPSEGGTRVLVLPRDLAVGRGITDIDRLATSYLAGPQRTINLLCSSLGVTVTHLVSVNMAQFARIVDSLGGAEVSIDEPIRDPGVGLDIPTAGTHTLDGVTALALVRSRRPQVLREGTWVALSESDGATQRSHYTGVMVRALMSALGTQAHNPLRAQALAWSLSDDLQVDAGTGVLDLVQLGRALVASSGPVEVSTVPAPTQGDTFVALPTTQTYEVLAGHGYAPGRCQPAS